MNDPRNFPVSVVSDDPALNIDTEAPVESLPEENGKRTHPPTHRDVMDTKRQLSPEELDEDRAATTATVAAQDKIFGDPMPSGSVNSAEEIWLDPLEALLNATPQQVVPERDMPVSRFRMKLRFRAIPTARWNRIQADNTVRRRDPKTAEVVTTLKEREMKVQVILESCINLDFGNKDIWRKFGAHDVHTCVEAVLLPGEIDSAAILIREISGFQFTELEEEAGNS